MWFAYLYRRGAIASEWVPDPDEVAAAPTEAECVTGILEPPWDATYELGVDPLPDQIADIRPQVVAPVPRLFARIDTADWSGQTYEYVGVKEDPTAPAPLPPNPLPREPLEAHSVQAVHLLPPVGAAGQLLALSGTQELVWQDPATTGLADGSVTNPKLAANAVTADKIADSTITGAELAAGTITADKLAVGVVPAPPGTASDTTPGLIQIATTAEVQAGTDTLKAVTPGRLVGRTATETRTGLVELATTAEAVAGTDTVRAVTPAGLQASLAAIPAMPPASEATAGILRIATEAEVTTGTDDSKAMTPLKLATRLVNASETQRGMVELATQAEVTAGSTDQAAVTPLKLQQRLTEVLPQAASETLAGLVELATQAEVTTGTDAVRAVTPLQLQYKLTAAQTGTALRVTRYTAGGQTQEAVPGMQTSSDGKLGIGSAPSPNAPLYLGSAQGPKIYVYENVNSRYGIGLGSSTMQVFSAGTLTGRVELGAMSNTDGTTFTGHLSIVGSTGTVGLATSMTATLGASASYQRLNVNGSMLYVGQSSVQERAQALLSSSWVTSTDATRTARLTVAAYDTTAAREGLRVEADGTAARLGFYGAVAVVRPTVSAAATDATTTQALANSLRTALLSLGLCV